MRRSRVIAAAVLFVALVASGVRAEPGAGSERRETEQHSEVQETATEQSPGAARIEGEKTPGAKAADGEKTPGAKAAEGERTPGADGADGEEIPRKEETDDEKNSGSTGQTEEERMVSISLADQVEPDENGAYPVAGEEAVVRLAIKGMEAGVRVVRWGSDGEISSTVFHDVQPQQTGDESELKQEQAGEESDTKQWKVGDAHDGWEVTAVKDGRVTGLIRVVRLAATEAVRSVTLEADDCAGATAPAVTLRYYRAKSGSDDTSGENSGGAEDGESGSGESGGSGGSESSGEDGEPGSGEDGEQSGGGNSGSSVVEGKPGGEDSNQGSGAEGGGQAEPAAPDSGGGAADEEPGGGAAPGGTVEADPGDVADVEPGGSPGRPTDDASGAGGSGTGTADAGKESAAKADASGAGQESAAKVDVRGVEQEGLYTGDVRGAISLRDADTGSSTVRLLKVNADGSTEDVSDRFLQGGDAAVRLRIPQAGHANDGIYRIEVDARDAAGNVHREQRIFSVNTAGSLFAYSAALESMRGAFLRRVSGAIRVTEYNPAPIRAGSTRIEILCDGAQIDVSRIRQMIEEGGTDGWHRCIYEIPADCFEQEGVYQVNVICLDAAGHAAESALTQGPVSFTIDRTPPQVRHVRIGAARDQEEGTAKGQRTVDAAHSGRVLAYEAFDAAGLASAVVYAGEDELERRDDFLGEVRVSAEAGLPEEDPAGGFRLVVTDRAGNETEEHIDVPRAVGGAAVRRVFAGVHGGLAAVILAACAALAAGVLRALRRIDK